VLKRKNKAKSSTLISSAITPTVKYSFRAIGTSLNHLNKKNLFMSVSPRHAVQRPPRAGALFDAAVSSAGGPRVSSGHSGVLQMGFQQESAKFEKSSRDVKGWGYLTMLADCDRRGVAVSPNSSHELHVKSTPERGSAKGPRLLKNADWREGKRVTGPRRAWRLRRRSAPRSDWRRRDPHRTSRR
jgi:hypothetical protein